MVPVACVSWPWRRQPTVTTPGTVLVRSDLNLRGDGADDPAGGSVEARAPKKSNGKRSRRFPTNGGPQTALEGRVLLSKETHELRRDALGDFESVSSYLDGWAVPSFRFDFRLHDLPCGDCSRPPKWHHRAAAPASDPDRTSSWQRRSPHGKVSPGLVGPTPLGQVGTTQAKFGISRESLTTRLGVS